MCGIIAVLRRRSSRPTPQLASVLARLDLGVARLGDAVAGFDGSEGRSHEELAAIAGLLEQVDRELRGPPGLACLIGHRGDGPGFEEHGYDQVEVRGLVLAAMADHLEETLDTGKVLWSPEYLEAVNEVLVRLRDVIWAIGRDRPDTAREVLGLARLSLDGDGQLPAPARDALWSVQVALSALDRLEVRGRDSAGLHLLVTGHGIDLQRPEIQAMLGARANDPLFTSMALRTPLGHLSLVYKAAAEIGELGDNTRALRAAITSDPLLHLALADPDAEVT
ncbi:MAG: hypothetical protein QOF30_3420, partial [Acidimicrobiaceae bacterium]|nr:hypothetical protein [Acidimicrobiaceae bacterium]